MTPFISIHQRKSSLFFWWRMPPAFPMVKSLGSVSDPGRHPQSSPWLLPSHGPWLDDLGYYDCGKHQKTIRSERCFSALSDVQEHQALDKNIFEDLAAMAAEIEDLEEMAVTKVNAMKGPSCRKIMRIERDHRNGFHMFNEHM